jgi:hypothetical protein
LSPSGKIDKRFLGNQRRDPFALDSFFACFPPGILKVFKVIKERNCSGLLCLVSFVLHILPRFFGRWQGGKSFLLSGIPAGCSLVILLITEVPRFFHPSRYRLRQT